MLFQESWLLNKTAELRSVSLDSPYLGPYIAPVITTDDDTDVINCREGGVTRDGRRFVGVVPTSLRACTVVPFDAELVQARFVALTTLASHSFALIFVAIHERPHEAGSCIHVTRRS